MDLCNKSTLLSRKVSKEFFGKALELARLYGWKPIGTHPPLYFDAYVLNTEWTGSYLTNDGQIVSREDAISFAAALERSLEDIPDTSLLFHWDASLWAMDDFPEWLTPDEVAFMEDGLEEFAQDASGIHPCTFFAGNEKKHLTDLIRFCRLGSFVIL